MWRARWQRRRPVSVASLLPIGFAVEFLGSADVPPYVQPFLIVFGAVLPLMVIGATATATANAAADRRARRSMRPRPRSAYLFMALGWALAGGAAALLAWAAGARSTGPGVGEDWIATGLVWATMISACAVVMMLIRALTAGGRPRRPLPG
jgi:uncharacterized membrane protein YraQ (UPF0718 family)